MRASSLKLKFTIIAVVISLISFGAAALFSIQWMAEEIRGDYKEKADLISLHIIGDLESSMLRTDHEEILRTISVYKKHQDVQEVRVLGPKGEEAFAQPPGRSEPRVEEAFRTGTPIDFSHEINKTKVTTFIIPIKNKPECYRCHEKSEPVRGLLLLSLNQEFLEQNIGQHRAKLIILFALLTLIVSTSTMFAVNRLFLRRLKNIQQGAEAVEKGNLTYQIPVKSNDEVGALARNFNHMAQKLKSVIRELEDKNRQLTEQIDLVSLSQKEWQETFDCITDPIAVIDSDCTIHRTNKAFLETFKELFKEYPSVPQSGIINKKCDELFGTCFSSDCPHKIGAPQGGPMRSEIVSPNTGKIFEISIFPYRSLEKGLKRSVAIVEDVTEKKEAEMRLVMTERLAALGQMASGIAHEINNPLATIAACAEGLLKRVEKEGAGSLLIESYLKIIEEEINRCQKITKSMLSFVKKPDAEKGATDINEALDKAVEMISLQNRLRDVTYLRNLEQGIPLIPFSEGELIQVFQSIITNALDAMKDKGTLAIETRTAGQTLLVKISDTGDGIPSDHIGRIFAPFFTTKPGGTGLGLAIAAKIIEENKGKIDVTSEEGKGTTFTITLPTLSSAESEMSEGGLFLAGQREDYEKA